MVFQDLQACLSGTTANEMLRRRALKRAQIRLSIGESGSSPLRASYAVVGGVVRA